MEKEQVRTELRLMGRLNKFLDVLAQEKHTAETYLNLIHNTEEQRKLYERTAQKYQELIDRTINDLHNLIDKYGGAIEGCLSPEEKAIAVAIFVQGRKIFEVAAKLFISERTINRIIEEIVRKVAIHLS